MEHNYDTDPNIVKDPFLISKLKAELEGILAWLVRGALEYQQEGLRPHSKSQKARDEYRDEMDLLKGWIDECCEIGDFTETSNNLWISWKSYAEAKGELRYIPNERSLGRRLNSKFKTHRTGSTRMRLGIRVRVSAEFADMQ